MKRHIVILSAAVLCSAALCLVSCKKDDPKGNDPQQEQEEQQPGNQDQQPGDQDQQPGDQQSDDQDEVDTTVYPDGTVHGSFSVAQGKVVYFSTGNLRAEVDSYGKAKKWSFAIDQYGVLKTTGANCKIGMSGGDVDLFYWVGKSGTEDAYGISRQLNTDGKFGTVAGEALKADWGKAVGDGKTWRTLSKDEWTYVISTRKTSTVGTKDNARYCIMNVADHYGLLLFPDKFKWKAATMGEEPKYINTPIIDWEGSHNYTKANFAAMEAAGCVFLPAGGIRHETTIDDSFKGSYWSTSSDPSNAGKAYSLYFNKGHVTPDSSNVRNGGYSVRLVTDAR